MRQFLLLLLIFFNSCSSFLYHPNQDFIDDPMRYGQIKEDLYFKSSDGVETLHGWYLSGKKQIKKGLILRFNQGKGNISSSFQEVMWLLDDGYDVLTFEYRGFGNSTGAPGPMENYSDALVFLNLGLEFFEKNEYPLLIIWGKGVGGMTAIRSLVDYPNRSKVGLMVMDNSFCSPQNLMFERMWARWTMKIFSPLSYLFISDEMECDSYLEKWDVPTLVIHGGINSNIPLVVGEKLYNDLPLSLAKWYWKTEGKGDDDSVVIHREAFNKLVEGLTFSRPEKSSKQVLHAK